MLIIELRAETLFRQELKKDLKGARGALYAVKADVSKQEEVEKAFAWIKKELGGVDVLVNNAGVAFTTTLHGM